MNDSSFSADIPLSAAIRAHRGTSFSPEKRGKGVVREYVETMRADYERFAKLAQTSDTTEEFGELFAQYRDAYRSRTLAWLDAKSRCVSTMIAGPSNFPVRRADKANESAMRRLEELVACREQWHKRIKKLVSPGSGPIMSGDADAIQQLEAKIARGEERQAHMKAVNAAVRKHRSPEALRDALAEMGLSTEAIEAMLAPAPGYKVGYQPFELTNNNANIRRLKARLESLQRAKIAPVAVVEGENARLEDCPPENRVRLFYPDKPDAPTRTALKSAGFRWTPSLGCWQAYRNDRTLETAREMSGTKEGA